ncbi:uncharacterized protein K441DRAFT_567808, partial [Cenococcum geophilum 1.58]|uniref:uncharacterized protein n=1 Tax=Cenococcum geophilum 1.58 TaxID=794803 RepID=UPI0035902891
KVKIFIKFANYYRCFIKGFSYITAPLNKLTKRELKKLKLDLKALKAFILLEKQFKLASLLIYFRLGMPIRIKTDASRFIILGILS